MSTFIEGLKTEGKEIICMEGGGVKLYFRKPSALEGMCFLDSLNKSGSILKAKEKFIRSLFVGENISQFDRFLQDKPFTFDKIVFALTKDLGSDINFTMAKVESLRN